MTAIKATQEAVVRIQGQPSIVIKPYPQKEAKEDDYGQNKKIETCGNYCKNAGRENKVE
jgi:hypothetical protein